MNKYLDISPEVQQALAEGKPVVAGEANTATDNGASFKCASTVTDCCGFFTYLIYAATEVTRPCSNESSTTTLPRWARQELKPPPSME